MTGTGCALCGRSGASRRLDLTFGELDDDGLGYSVLSVMRGVLICPGCMLTARIGDLLRLQAQGVGLVYGCLVQCAGRPPWHLKTVLPGGFRWRKVTCPACEGRASLQVISEAAARRPSALAEGFRQAFRLLDPRRPEEDGNGNPDPVDGGHGNSAAGGPEVRGMAVDTRGTGPGNPDAAGDPDEELPARAEA